MAKGGRCTELPTTRLSWQRANGVIVALALLVFGLLPGCTKSATSRIMPPGFVSCEGVTRTPGWCRSLTVPTDWANPSGPTTALWVNILPATGSPAPDPMFYLEGGPGGAATQAVSWAASTFKQINETHDLVFVDQPGTGRSEYLSCPGLDEGVAAGTLPGAVSSCLANVGTDAQFFTTPAAAQDLDAVRAALGYRKIDLYGVSYGVSLGLAYLRRYSSHVRSAVFDSGSLLDTPLWQEAPLHADQAFDLLVRRCASTPACAQSYNPAADLTTVLAQLRANPDSVATFLSALDDDYLAKSTAVVLLPADLHLAAVSGLPALAHKRQSLLGSQLSQPTPLMPLTVECGDAWAAIDPKAIAQSSTFAPMMVVKSAYLSAICPIWSHDPGVSGTVRTTVPILFLNGTADPTDPPANVAAAKATMPNAVLVSIPGSAHWVLSASWNWGSATPACLLNNIATFVDSGRPANRSSWDACTATIAKLLPRFPAAQ